MLIGMVTKADVGADMKWIKRIGVEDSSISFMLDTGSDVNIISDKEYQSIKPMPEIDKKPCHDDVIQRLTHYKHRVVQYDNRRISTRIEVVDSDTCRPAPLSGLDWRRLGLVKRVHTMQSEVSCADETLRTEVKKKYPQLFQETGSVPGVHSIVLKDGTTGVVHAPRRVAVVKRSQLKKELEREVEVGFLAYVNEPTDWVITEKSNETTRLWIDPKVLSKEIKREQFQIPTKE